MQTFQEESLLNLLERYKNNQLTETEAKELFELIDLEGARELLAKMAEADSNGGHSSINLPEANWNRIWEKIEEAKRPAPDAKRQTNLLTRFSMMTFLLLVVVGTVYFLYYRNATKSIPIAVQYKGDVAPGHNGAVLHLSDGSLVVLDSVANGTVALQGKIQVVKENGGLKYVGKTSGVIYNIITTNKGRQWQLQLPDGSNVWLNAASSIRYPLSFTGKERMVEITGEAYFEVKHNARQPFRVKAGTRIIEDIGTAFNVNAYADEPAMKTTLVEGSVKIISSLSSGSQAGGVQDQRNSQSSSEVILKPGQQAIIMNENIKVNPVNVASVIAWKNGFFGFEHTDIHAVMRQLARWYDVAVQFEGKSDNTPFQGKIGRSLTLVQVLKGLEQVHVHFRIEEDKRIVILP